ncbi:MAG: hypothetical protein JHC31_05755 [Sulfurihydrogenibium sp.]|jgi:hypothetical protein|nr:hypothetical protein [Sulfurihydrogenibium sp.]
MKKSLNVLKLFSLGLVLPFLLNSCATKNTKKMDWVPDPSVIERAGIPSSRPEEIEKFKKDYLKYCEGEAEWRVYEMHKKEINSIWAHNCGGAQCFKASSMYPRDFQYYFKQCMTEHGFRLVEVENK